MLDRRAPYTSEHVKVLYPVLTEVECRMVSHIEHSFQFWPVWPYLNENSAGPEAW